MKFIIPLLLLLSLASCDTGETPQERYDRLVEYQLYTTTEIPDSNKTKMASFIIEATKAASFHMTTADYEDPEDVIEEAGDQARLLFSVDVPGLKIIKPDGTCNYVLKRDLTPKLQKIYDSLSNSL